MKTRAYKQVLPLFLFLIIGVVLFPSAGRDDVHITYWSAHALSNFGEILNYNGARIEQSSSLLHTLILASLNYITHINIVNIGTFVSIFFGLLTIHLIGILSFIMKQEKLFPQIFASTAVPLLYWSFGGLETSIVSSTILFLLITTIKFSSTTTIENYLLAVVAIILYLLVRPEAFFVASLFLFIPSFISFLKKEKYFHFLMLFVTTSFLFIIITTFRYSYFGAISPQPVEAKIGTSIIEKIHSGISYYFKSATQYPIFILLALPIAFYMTIKIKETLKEKNLIIIISMLLTYALFALLSGGDWMEGARFFVPTIGPAIVLASLFYIPLIEKKNAFIFGVLLNLLFLVYFTMKHSTSYPIYNYKNYVAAMPNAKEFSLFEITNRVHYRDIPFIIELDNILEKVTSNGILPTIMSIQAGMVPYHVFQKYYKQARFIDFRALSTRDFTTCKITNSLPKDQTGIVLTYEYFFSHFNSLHESCDIAAPDIIYDLDWKDLRRVRIIEQSGYTLVYLQTGDIVNHGLFKSENVEGTQFIAVKTDIAKKLDLKIKRFKFL